MDASRYTEKAEAQIGSSYEKQMADQRRNEDLEQKNAVLTLEICDRMGIEVRLRKEKEALLEKIADLEKKLGNAEREARDSKVYAELVEKMLDKANDASSPSSEELVMELKEKVGILQVQCDAEREGFREMIAEADEEIIELKANAAKSASQIQELTAQLEAAVEERDEAKKNAVELTEKLEETAEDLSDLDELNNTVQIIFNDRHALREQLKTMTREHEQQREELHNEVARLKAELGETEQTWKSEKASWGETIRCVETVKMEHKEALLANKELLEKSAELAKEVSRIQEELDERLEEILENREEIQYFEKSDHEAHERLREVGEQLKRWMEVGERLERTKEQCEMNSRLYQMECHVRRDCEKRCSNLKHEKSELTGMVVELETQTAGMAEEIKRLVAERDGMEQKYRHVVENLGVEELSDEMLNFELEDEEEELSVEMLDFELEDEESSVDGDEQESKGEEQNDE